MISMILTMIIIMVVNMMIMAMVISFLISSELSDCAEIVVQGELKASARSTYLGKKNYSTS